MRWFYSVNGEQRGPVSASELTAIVEAGTEATVDSMVWREGMEKWVPYRDAAHEFASAAASTSEMAPYAPPASATKTTQPRIQPEISLGSAFQTSWELFRAHFGKLIILVLILQLPVNILFDWAMANVEEIPPDPFTWILVFLLPLLTYIFVYTIFEGAILVCIHERWTSGSILPTSSLILKGLKLWGKLFVTGLLVVIIILPSVCAVLVGVIPWGAFFVFAIPLIVIENAWGPQAVGRSFELVKQRYLPALLAILFAVLANIAIAVPAFVIETLELPGVWIINSLLTTCSSVLHVFELILFYVLCQRYLQGPQSQAAPPAN